MSAPHRGHANQRVARRVGRMLAGYALLFLAEILSGAAHACVEAGEILTRSK